MPRVQPQERYDDDDQERIRHELEQDSTLYRQQVYGTDDEFQLQAEIDEADEGEEGDEGEERH